ncbi:hypothetical protein ABZ413_24865 [Nocardia rhamnosiphila]|uniref:hypothetical protein n=1 Tax=Nocardia rhamnosiphila TaxID=426716 RepID=UPI00340EC25C
MPLQPWMKLISVDGHIIEHSTVGTDRLPRTLRERGPRIVDEPSSTGGPPIQVWYHEDKRFHVIGLNGVAGKKPEDFGVEPVRYADTVVDAANGSSRVTGRRDAAQIR